MVILFQLPTIAHVLFSAYKMLLPKKISDRHILVGSDTTMWVSVARFLDFLLNRHLRLQEHISNCCLPQALGGDVPESNAHDFYEFCKENAHIVEQKYRYLKSWTKKEETLHPFFM